MFTLVSARCSEALKFSLCFFGAVAIFLATALLVDVPMVEAAVHVDGVPSWMADAAERGLDAVVLNMPADVSSAVKAQLLQVVGEKLFTGYKIKNVLFTQEKIHVQMERSTPLVPWSVEILLPHLEVPVAQWFSEDVQGMAQKVEELLAGVPLEAFAWCDAELKGAVEQLYEETLPGWRISLLVRTKEGNPSLQIAFSPEQPLTLAIDPKVRSNSLPTLFYSGIREDLLRDYAPIIGLPVGWVERHRDDLSAWSKKVLSKHRIVQQARIEPKVEITPAPLSAVDVDLESRRFTVWFWLAAYMGNSDRYPEVGLHLGRRAQLFPHTEMELYGEFVSTVNDWSLESRLGGRWSPWGDVWVGVEWVNPGDSWWARFSIDSRPRKPYFWVRFNTDRDLNSAVGWRFSEHFSVEMHYDSRDRDYWSIRAIANL